MACNGSKQLREYTERNLAKSVRKEIESGKIYPVRLALKDAIQESSRRELHYRRNRDNISIKTAKIFKISNNMSKKCGQFNNSGEKIKIFGDKVKDFLGQRIKVSIIKKKPKVYFLSEDEKKDTLDRREICTVDLDNTIVVICENQLSIFDISDGD